MLNLIGRAKRSIQEATEGWSTAFAHGGLWLLLVFAGIMWFVLIGMAIATYQQASSQLGGEPRTATLDLSPGEDLPVRGAGASPNTTLPRFTSSRTPTEWRPSNHWSPRGPHNIEAVMVHVGVVAPSNCDGLANYLANNDRGVSAHFTVCNNRVIQQVELGDAAHHGGRWGPPNLEIPVVRDWWNATGAAHNPNVHTVGIETALGGTDAHINSQTGMRENLIELITWLVLEFDLPPDRSHIIAHSDTDGRDRAQDPHGWVNLQQIIDEVALRVERREAPGPAVEVTLDLVYERLLAVEERLNAFGAVPPSCAGPKDESWGGQWDTCREVWVGPNGDWFDPATGEWHSP